MNIFKRTEHGAPKEEIVEQVEDASEGNNGNLITAFEDIFHGLEIACKSSILKKYEMFAQKIDRDPETKYSKDDKDDSKQAFIIFKNESGKQVTIINETVTVNTKSCAVLLQHPESAKVLYHAYLRRKLFGVSRDFFMTHYEMHKTKRIKERLGEE